MKSMTRRRLEAIAETDWDRHVRRSIEAHEDLLRAILRHMSASDRQAILADPKVEKAVAELTRIDNVKSAIQQED